MSADLQAQIQTVATTLAAEHPALQADVLARFIGDIIDWNDRVGLVSRRSPLPTVGRLVRQSVDLHRLLDEGGVIASDGGRSVVDVGSGAGFPGLVWKLLQPNLPVTLVERRQRKATFLQRSVVVLGLRGVEVVHGDASEVANYERFLRQLDVVVSFAVAGPDEMARLVEPFLKPGGHYCTMRPRAETAQPSRIGRFLGLEGVFDRQYGRFCLYRRDVVAGTDGSTTDTP